MEDAPLNLAHFYERKAKKFLKHRRFDEAEECFNKSLYYIEEGLKTVQMPAAIQVFIVQEEEYKRQIELIKYQKTYYSTKQTDDKDFHQPDELEHGGADSDAADINKVSRTESLSKISICDDKTYEDERKFLNLDLKITEIPNLAPLELPNFDFQIFEQSSSGISSFKRN